MHLLLIGGTRFSGRALAGLALGAGHSVTLFHRGSTGADLFPEAEHVFGDRNVDLSALQGRRFDAVVDLCGGLPRVVRASAQLLADSGWYGYVSSISAHVAGMPPGATEDWPTHGPPFPETEAITEDSYGPLKVACEREVLEVFGDRAAIFRPGYIVGPHDPTDRFTSLLRRAAAGGRMVVPGPSHAALQFVDARDLAAFYFTAAEARRSGIYNVVHPQRTATIGQVVDEAGGGRVEPVWVDGDWLIAALGDQREQAFPIWGPEDPGFHELDPSRAIAAGFVHRPIAETIRDTLAWDRADRGIRPTFGLPAEREAELLAAWDARR